MAFAGGLVCGAAGFWLLAGDAGGAAGTAVPDAAAALNGAATAPAAPDKDLLGQIEEQQLEINRLNQLLRSAGEEPPQPTREEREQARREEFDRRMDAFAARRAEEMAASLGLGDAQRALLQDVFRAQMDNMRARRHGEEVEPFNLDDELAKVLTPEQFDAYLESTQQEIYNRAELLATTQVVRMNQLLQLAPEQMDPVYEAINYTAQEMLIARQTGEPYSMREALDQRLSTVLTAEQMTQYKEQMGAEGFGGGPGGGGGRGRGPGFLGP